MTISDETPPSFVSKRTIALLSGLVLVMGGGIWLGLPGGLLISAAIALSLVIGLIWQSLQHLSGETKLTFEEALSLAAPTSEEEQKRAVLRALKDLEYERSVGKISEEDFKELSERYRAEAKRLILAVDDSLEERRLRAQKLLEERLNASPPPARSRKKSRASQDDDAPPPAEQEQTPPVSTNTTDEGQASAEGEAS